MSAEGVQQCDKKVSRETAELSRLKRIARSMANRHKRNGLIEVKPCSQCGNDDAVMHHPDYSKPLDIIWLCRDCHKAAHRIDVAGQIELRRAGRRGKVHHGGTLCSGCYSETPMAGQRYGKACHAKRQQAYRAEAAKARKAAKQLAQAVLGHNDAGAPHG